MHREGAQPISWNLDQTRQPCREGRGVLKSWRLPSYIIVFIVFFSFFFILF